MATISETMISVSCYVNCNLVYLIIVSNKLQHWQTLPTSNTTKFSFLFHLFKSMRTVLLCLEIEAQGWYQRATKWTRLEETLHQTVCKLTFSPFGGVPFETTDAPCKNSPTITETQRNLIKSTARNPGSHKKKWNREGDKESIAKSLISFTSAFALFHWQHFLKLY